MAESKTDGLLHTIPGATTMVGPDPSDRMLACLAIIVAAFADDLVHQGWSTMIGMVLKEWLDAKQTSAKH